jgi:hypothetical protein
MTRMKSLTDHLAAIHARIKENAEKKLAAQPELDLGIDDDQAAPEQPATPPRPSRRRCGASVPSCCRPITQAAIFSCATCSTTP